MSDEKKTWVERFPKPEGERPPNPGEAPKWDKKVPNRMSVDGGPLYTPEWIAYSKAKTVWEEANEAHNNWGYAKRRFIVAVALDDMNERKNLTLVENAVYVLGIAYLEGTLNSNSPNIFDFFGGLL